MPRLGRSRSSIFTSYERDSETGTDYAVNRQYIQNIGRFQRVDPASGSTSAPQTLNRYIYGKDNPVGMVDPTGLNLQVCELVTWWGHIEGGELDGWEWEYSYMTCFSQPDIIAVGSSGGDDGDSSEPAPKPANLRARLRKLLEKNNNDCGNFVQSLIDQAGKDSDHGQGQLNPIYSDYVPDLFDAINGPNGGGYVIVPVVLDGHSAGGTVDGSMGNIGVPNATPPTVRISPISYMGDYSLESAQNTYVHIALHETIHLAGSRAPYDDRQLATAALGLGGLSQADIDQYNDIKGDTWKASAFWDTILTRHCPY